MTFVVNPLARVGHVHLKVSDLDRSVAFYRDVLGFEVQQMYGSRAAFLSAGGYHHHIGLNTWESAGSGPAPRRAPGLYHAAFVYPDRHALGVAVAQVVASGVKIVGAADHGVSQAVYFDDPDGNGVELYWDRPEDAWPRDAEGRLKMVNDPLDVSALIADAQLEQA